MGKRKKPEEIKRLLAEAERDLSRGLSVVDICRKMGVSEATYHRWRQCFQRRQRRRDSACPAPGVRGRPPQGTGRRAPARQPDAPGRGKKKVVTASQQRACAAYLQENYSASERRTSRVLGCSRSTLRYQAASRQRDLPLLEAIKRLAQASPMGNAVKDFMGQLPRRVLGVCGVPRDSLSEHWDPPRVFYPGWDVCSETVSRTCVDSRR